VADAHPPLAPDDSSEYFVGVPWPLGEVTIEDDAGGVLGPVETAHITRDEDTGIYGYQTYDRAKIFRATAVFTNDDDSLDLRCVDQDGRPWRYRVVPV